MTETQDAYTDQKGVRKDLKDLVKHNKCPVLIAEFGIPASRSILEGNDETGIK